MIKARFKKHTLQFKQASGTSRGVLKTKETWIIILEKDNKKGFGECGMFKGLSIDDRIDYEDKLTWVINNINKGLHTLLPLLTEFPSIQIGLETAFLSLNSQDPFQIYPSKFSKENTPIPINGLIWMGTKAFMKQQIKEKIEAGFTCIKMKIGAIDFIAEIDLLKSIRKEFTANDIELRVDANGAFNPDDALERLKVLSDYNLHSIEQPIKQGQIEAMAYLCENTPLPIALDEELIGVFNEDKKARLLKTIQPQYIILKPTLVGGFAGSDSWINTANSLNIGWWITSALESNIGLNAIAQYTYKKNSLLPQGLGTGGLFTNNFTSPLYINNGALAYNNLKSWDLKI